MMLARIRWFETEEGGRKQIPEGCRYSAPACIDGHSEFPDCSWSLNIETTSGQTFSRSDKVKIQFFVQQAPHEWLTPGTLFTMYEGRRKVLEGVIESE
jgi:hypothetical protein